ncbi:MAG: 16S rRNA (adenine(1518)-N(6)/adenine(1519)-N(6))-dimethyltransferase RsmA [Proteobacteria bacterium]|jgi:16S rRNA (adenine1518-N6/adenine1519-N6)-dimethyltransferase|nr:16S rRNA (adenine(1518)-N(6)/adenine(1519)-N(6))-dimethyltransferase RsmA [Pseudomonadota bacterium]
MTPARLGQHFLRDNRILQRIAEQGELTSRDLVVEIGVGRGELTRHLVEKAGKVVAFEIDPALIRNIDPGLLARENLQIQLGDGLRVSFPALAREWKRPVKLIANLPFQISSPLIQKLAAERESLALAVLLLQKEFALRLTAEPGRKNYGSITVLASLYFESEICFSIPPSYFTPQPKVDSTLIKLRPRLEPQAEIGNPTVFQNLLKHAFQGRRKTLQNALRPWLGKSSREILHQAGIDPGRRPDTLKVEEFARISLLLMKNPDLVQVAISRD